MVDPMVDFQVRGMKENFRAIVEVDFGPEGAAGCSHGWSPGPAGRNPWTARDRLIFFVLSFRPGRGGGMVRFPPPLSGRKKNVGSCFSTGGATFRATPLHPRLQSFAPAGAADRRADRIEVPFNWGRCCDWDCASNLKSPLDTLKTFRIMYGNPFRRSLTTAYDGNCCFMRRPFGPGACRLASLLSELTPP